MSRSVTANGLVLASFDVIDAFEISLIWLIKLARLSDTTILVTFGIAPAMMLVRPAAVDWTAVTRLPS